MSHLRQWKLEQRKFSALTAYDASFAKLFSEQGVNVLLGGNSLSMTLQGHNSTLPVTVAAI
ncbi:MAG: 3-methyl-2-oxobutanoate hydroxymethyltransferase, partial [Serratia symbiotica]|nr:3-methyl-2-oxobutanoate hydroxymethyltransferase [Serratia symbiotica]